MPLPFQLYTSSRKCTPMSARGCPLPQPVTDDQVQASRLYMDQSIQLKAAFHQIEVLRVEAARAEATRAEAETKISSLLQEVEVRLSQGSCGSFYPSPTGIPRPTFPNLCSPLPGCPAYLVFEWPDAVGDKSSSLRFPSGVVLVCGCTLRW